MSRILLLSLVSLLLAGCVAGPVPIVGYPTGQTPGEMELKATSSTQNGAVQQIYEQTIAHDYRLLLSPDGGRDSIPLKSGFRYFAKTGEGPLQELKFLSSDPTTTMEGESLKHIFPLGGGRWLGFAEHNYSTLLFVKMLLKPDAPVVEEHKYYLVAFSAEKELARQEISSKTELPEPEFDAATGTLRLHFDSGWKSYRLNGSKLTAQVDPN